MTRSSVTSEYRHTVVRLVGITILALTAWLPTDAASATERAAGPESIVRPAFAGKTLAPALAGLSQSARPDRANAPTASSESANTVLPPGAEQDWWSAVQKDIATSAYNVTRQNETALADLPAAYQAPNRAQGFRTYFTDRGIRVVPRSDEQPAWQWGLDLVGLGWVDNVTAVVPVEPSVRGNRVEYARSGLLEWYVNEPRGLEQGFIIERPASGSEAADESQVVVELSLRGGLAAYPSEDGQSIELEHGGVRVLRYAELKVTDAAGHVLPARMDVSSQGGEGARVRLVVDAGAAVWPITIDPLATSPSWTAESDQASANFGFEVASAGDVNGDGYADVIVSAYRYDNGQTDEGRVFVYHGSTSGLLAGASWSAEGNQASANFGFSAASAGDVNGDGYADVIIGAPYYDNGQANEGCAFVYHGSASGLSASASWTAESDQASARFGYSVASAGDVSLDGYADVIVGAPAYNNGEAGEGRAFVYHGAISGLLASASWTAESHQANAGFGYSVASAGDVNGDGFADVIVGVYAYDNVQTDEGRALVYYGSLSGLLASATWSAESDQTDAWFGSSVASAGDVNGDGYADVIIGAYRYDNGQTDEGRVFVYLGSGSGLATSASWSAESNQASAYFGSSVASVGDVDGNGYADVLIGAPNYDNGQADEGRAFVYYGSASGLSGIAAWTAESNQASAQFGCSVATAGDVNGDGYSDVIVGASQYDNGQSDEGCAFVYHGSASTLSPTAEWTADGNQADASFGFPVASAGDVNGDGYADVIIGAPYFDGGETDEGRAFVYHGSASGLSSVANWTAEDNQAGARFGVSAASAGDVNGDGYADVIIGAADYTNGQTREGRAYVYHGSASGLSATANWAAESDQTFAWYGFSVAGAGDVNGDGYADVIVGSYNYQNGESGEGRAFVYHGSASGVPASASWIAEINKAGAWFGNRVASAGDVNGDGYADVIVGADYYTNGQTQEGGAFVFHGSSSGLSAAPNWTAESNQANSLFGSPVASAGDVNGDGYADVIVGASAYDNSEAEEGRAYVFHGSSAGLSPTANWNAESNQTGARFGGSAASAGDVNGDGFADVIIGAGNFDNVETSEGRALVYHGSASGLSGTAVWSVEGNLGNAYLGSCVASAGDVNGDGYADVIVSAISYTNGEANEGRAFVYYGNGGTGRPVVARQLYGNSFTPVQPWGSAGDSNELYVRSRHSSPLGRERVKIQVEACPSGTAFGHPSCIAVASTWFDTTVSSSGTQLTQKLAVPGLNSLYRWRARTLRAPFWVTRPGITAPPNPAHGPWRRLMGQAFEADVRTGSKYTLTAITWGSGSGRVISSPAGLSCTAMCTATFTPDTVVTLTTTPDAGSVFAGWYGACSGVGACQVTMSSSREVYASFSTPYTLNVSKSGAGSGVITSSPAGIDCGFHCMEVYTPGTVVTLTAVAAAGSSFAGWSGGGCSGVGECQVTMSTAYEIWGVFDRNVTATGFYPITPCRALDTRVSSGPSAAAPALAAGSRRDFSLVDTCGLPSGAKAISANLTVVAATAQGDLQVIASHVPSTITSSLSIPISRARANNAIVELSNDGLRTISVINPTTGSVHLILDINGYFL